RPVPSCRLAVAADPEAGEREQERGEAERPEPGDIEQQSRPEAREGPEDRSLREGDCDDRDENEIRRAAEDPDRLDDRDLHHDGEEEEPGRFRRGQDHGTARLVGTSTRTTSRDVKSTSGSTCTSWNGSMSVCPTFVTRPIGMSRG